MKVLHGKVAGRPPALDIEMEKRVQAACLAMNAKGLLHSAHDVSEGGLAVTLAECAMSGDKPVGAELALPTAPLSETEALFSEAPSRIVISFSPSDRAAVEKLAQEAGAPLEVLGRTGGRSLVVGKLIDVATADLARTWREGFRHVVA